MGLFRYIAYVFAGSFSNRLRAFPLPANTCARHVRFRKRLCLPNIQLSKSQRRLGWTVRTRLRVSSPILWARCAAVTSDAQRIAISREFQGVLPRRALRGIREYGAARLATEKPTTTFGADESRWPM